MAFVRPLDWDHAEMVLPHGYKGRFLYSAEECQVVATLVPPGAKGPPQHRHLVDQIYVIASGTVRIQLVRRASVDGPGPEAPGISNHWPVTSADNSEHAAICLTCLEPRSIGTTTHIHTLQALYHVTEDTLSTQIALDRYDAHAGSLVSIPAGVPHRFWNTAGHAERHVTILVPSPPGAGATDDPGAIAVTVTATSQPPSTLQTSLSAT
jgi:quercetin dioxygenase-like cupin family protein